MLKRLGSAGVRFTKVIILIALLVAPPQWIIGQSKPCTNRPRRLSVSALKEWPSLRVDYSRVARFKLASRKSSYRVGEMVSLDLAILNTSKSDTFFLQTLPWTITLAAYDEKGIRVGVFPFSVEQLGFSQNLYTLLKPDVIALGSFQLLVGCDEQASFMEAKSRIFNESFGGNIPVDKNAFERNLFVNWGDGCFKVTGKESYTVIAEITNKHVIVSSCPQQVKTAVGTLQSTPLKLSIID